MNGCAELAGQDARRDADLAHADPDGRDLAVPHQLQHPHVIVRLVGHRGDLDDVGVELGQARVDLRQVLGSLAEVVQADDALRLAVDRDPVGNVRLQIHVLHPFGDGGPQQHQPRLLTPLPLALVLQPPARDNHRAPALAKQPLQIDLSADVVQADLDQLSALLHQMSMFRHHVPVTTRAILTQIIGRIHRVLRQNWVTGLGALESRVAIPRSRQPDASTARPPSILLTTMRGMQQSAPRIGRPRPPESDTLKHPVPCGRSDPLEPLVELRGGKHERRRSSVWAMMGILVVMTLFEQRLDFFARQSVAGLDGRLAGDHVQQLIQQIAAVQQLLRMQQLLDDLPQHLRRIEVGQHGRIGRHENRVAAKRFHIHAQA